MVKKFFFIGFLLSAIQVSAQLKNGLAARPKLVVGLMVDQMRWDFLYRYYNKYADKGFKRLLNEGYSCENTMIPYTPTVTACGHTCVYTGSVPAIHGIAGNNWYARPSGSIVYCTDDSTVASVGGTPAAGRMSPRNLLTTTIGDELKIATNFRSKVIGIALKDRGAILSAGHSADAAFWFDGSTGNFITSSYYRNDLPAWVKSFNDQRLPAEYIKSPWTTLYPVHTYTESTADDKPYETRYAGAANSAFPHPLTGTATNPYGIIASSPFGNTLTLQFARKAIEAYQLGKENTDMLCISLSSTDYVGHQFGPNSIETEDTYLRLDKDLGDFFAYLDKTIGKNQYLLFLTADHGVAGANGFLQEARLPAGSLNESRLLTDLNNHIEQQFSIRKSIAAIENYQLYLNESAVPVTGKQYDEVVKSVTRYLDTLPGIAFSVDLHHLNEAVVPEPLKTMLVNGYNKKTSGDIQLIPQPGWQSGYNRSGTGHGVWLPYDAHIPLVWMGWHISHGDSHEGISMTDIAPTLAALLHIQMPSGCVGKPITGLTDRR